MLRPLSGEPLAVDLLNTCWRHRGREIDLLESVDGLAQWLAESGQPDVRARETVRAALVHARAAIRAAVEEAPGAEDAVNGVLARGVTVRTLQGGEVRERVLFADEDWAPAWRAVSHYLTLRAAAPDGVRQCDQPECVLYFFDPSGRRRWCSMKGCGNRAKARRHHARRAAGTRAAAGRDAPVGSQAPSPAPAGSEAPAPAPGDG